jgi:hypothetical protein
MACRSSAGVFEQEAAGAGLQCFEDVGVGVVGGQDEDMDILESGELCDLAGGLDPVQLGHANVHEDDVGFRTG